LNFRKLAVRAIENWPAKVLSLGLAIILFVFHRMSTLEERFFSAPLNVELRGTLMPSSSYPRMIRVSLRGEANIIYPVMDEDIEVYINMENADSPGTYTVPVQWRKKGSAQGVEPLQINVEPMEITLSLDHKISKFVPLTASLSGYVDDGYIMTSYSLSPSQVIVDGPAELLGGVSELHTDPIDLNGRAGEFTLTVNIQQRNPLFILRGSGTAEFRGIISKVIPVRNILNVPIAVTGLREGFEGELETMYGSIHLEGENQVAVDSFNYSPDFLRVDCSGISEPGTYFLRVTAGAVSNVTIRIEPPEVKIQIIHAGEETS
jgi:hypothetical protein